MLHSPHMVQLSSLPTTGPVEQPLLQQQQQHPPPPMGMDPTAMMAHHPPPGPGMVADGQQVLGAGTPMQPQHQQQVVVTLSGTQTLPPSQMNGSLPGISSQMNGGLPGISNQMNGSLPGMLPQPQPIHHIAPPPGQIQMNGSALHVPHLNGGPVGPPIGQHHPHHVITSSVPVSMCGPLPTMTTAMNGALHQMNGGLQLQMHPHPPPQSQQGPLQQQQQVMQSVLEDLGITG